MGSIVTPYPSLAGRGAIDSGVRRLWEAPPSPNAVSPTTLLEFNGGSAAAGGLPERAARITALALQAGTAPTYSQPSPLLGAVDGSVLGNGGGYYLAGNNDDGNVSTLDLWLRVHEQVVASKVLFAKRTTGVGYVVGFDATPALYCTIQDASGSVTVTSAALVANTWVFAELPINRDDATMGGQWLISGAVSGALVDCSARALTLDAAVALAILADSAGANRFTSHLALVGIYARANWFRAGANGSADVLAEHKVQHAKLFGTRPLISIASATSLAAGGTTSPAYQERIVSSAQRLFYMGAGAPRFVERADSAGRVCRGVLVEAGARTSVGWSEAMPQHWSAPQGSVSPDDGPLPAVKVMRLTFTAGTQEVFDQAGIATSETLANKTTVVGLWMKRMAGATSIYVANTDCTAWATSWQQSVTLTDSWAFYHVRGSFHATATGSTANIVIGTMAHFGQGNKDAITLDVCAPTLQIPGSVVDYPAYYIPTTTAAVTRAADTPHRISGAAHFGLLQGALYFRFLSPTFTPARSHYLWTAYKAGSAATDYISCYIDTSGRVNLASAATAGSAGAVQLAGNCCDNAIRDCCVSWSKNQLRLWVRATGGWVEATKDAAFDVPAGLDTLDFGADNAAANQAGPILPGCEYQLVPFAVLDPRPAPGGFIVGG